MVKKYLKKAQDSWRAYLAEFLGTFVFTFISLGAVLSGIFFGEVGILGIAIASGFGWLVGKSKLPHLINGC